MDWTLVIHGGAGSMRRDLLGQAADAGARAGLREALSAGGRVLEDGGAALDAAGAAVAVLEDDPHFNAGRGAVFTWDEAIELDAAIMDGRMRAAGAVTGVRQARNPVQLARAVLDDGRHVLLSGDGADRFGEAHGVRQAGPGWFALPERLRQLHEIKAGAGFDSAMKYGTVGAVARDTGGRLAAATSTGGLTAKRWGRIGDSPLIGGGTYADDHAAVSCTGAGEAFIRAVAAHDLAARVRLAGATPGDAAAATLAEVSRLDGVGGLIFVGREGDGGWRFTTPAMYRGRIGAGGPASVAIYGDEP